MKVDDVCSFQKCNLHMHVSTSTYFNFLSYPKEIIYKTKVNLCCSALLADYCTIIIVLDHYSF